jgi:tetratricopeptide (TPR) repeat protein
VLYLYMGSCTTRAAAEDALVELWDGPCLQVDVLGCQDPPDLVRATGLALGLPLPGVTRAVANALEPGTLLIWRNLHAEEARTAAEALASLSADLKIAALGGKPIDGVPSSGLPPPPQLAPPDPLTLFPAGVPGQAHADQSRLRHGAPRVALKLELLEGMPQHPNPQAAAEALFHRAGSLLHLALSEALPAGLEHADLLFLRGLCEHLAPGLARAQAAAAGARLVAAAGQLPVALELLAAARPGAGDEGFALLHWAEGDLLLRQGLGAAATGHHEAALHLLLPDHPIWAATLLRRSADALAGLGEFDEAAARYRRARVLHRDAGDPLGVAATLRGAGDLAIQAGEVLSADALYEQAAAVMGGAQDAELGRANLCLGQAALATLRGETTGASLLLEQAEQQGRQRPVVQAGALRRRADIHLRGGKHEQAAKELEAAWALYLRAGEPHAAARCRRIQGDLAAVRGDLRAAAELYQQALTDSAQLGDLVGARQVLKHLLILERAGQDAERVEELLQQLAELDAELSSPDRKQAMRLG